MTTVRVHFMDGRSMEFETDDFQGLFRQIKAAAPNIDSDSYAMYFEGECGPAFRVDQVLWIEAIKVAGR